MDINNAQYKINILSLEGDKRKNKAHPRERVIQIIAIMERIFLRNKRATIPDIYYVF